MAKQELFEFEPELQIVARGAASNLLVVTFDTATDADHKRGPRMVMVKTEGVKSLTPQVSITSVAPSPQALDSQIYAGKITLVAEGEGGTAESYLLADFALELPANGKPGKDGKLVFPTEAQVEQVIRQGVADQFTQASLDLLATPEPGTAAVMATPIQGASGPAGGPWGGMTPAYAGGAMRQPSARAQAPSKKRWLTLIACVLLAFLATAAVFKMLTPRDPIQAAVAQAMKTDPTSRDEQIEITRQTLKEMGLDPGKTGDLGCLAPPQ